MMLTIAILLMGCATVILSLAVALAFRGQSSLLQGASRKLSRSLSWQLLGESAIGIGALAFAYAAHTGALQGWTLEFQSWIRLSMFLAASVTTLHLFLTVRNINR